MKNTILILGFLISLILSSCNDVDKKTISDDEAQTLLTEAVTAYSIYSGTQDQATLAGMQTEYLLSKSAQNPAPEEYPTITIDPIDLTTWPKTITIDFGSENVTGADGNKRRGIMIVEAKNFPGIEGAEYTITFSDYYHNDYKVEGTQTIKNMGLNSNQNPEYQCSVVDGVITSPDDDIFYFEQQTTREWIEGHDTHFVLTGKAEDLCDDRYEITGQHSGISSTGYSYNISTKEALVVSVCCRWVEDGILTVNMEDNDLSCEIDFKPEDDMGDSCNDQALFTIFGISIPINMK